ncbi:hypothetical protein HMPREF1448_00235 [Helicobacter pylori HP260AFi]|uniref:Uncharacterized protein n=1 Tax=Helicobacter pylori HP260AFii TaxID=1159077 RepID=A0ABC9SBH6_HELPX|nr:hypothetical protein HMPREF1416_00313 [Helicobacter pylori GAM260ASi]EMH31868.1 hypothetical protein HMPREF1422_00207 [Helicobacter pylori GAM268Bii]EMH64961.1 hypothetical protein HMPREF1448_00235 [Helicobacter pylori HP260AFi]EMH68739.1 hypothetical protein HMPREF1449_00210 [Helicobacter pylori HP260AFii]
MTICFHRSILDCNILDFYNNKHEATNTLLLSKCYFTLTSLDY